MMSSVKRMLAAGSNAYRAEIGRLGRIFAAD